VDIFTGNRWSGEPQAGAYGHCPFGCLSGEGEESRKAFQEAVVSKRDLQTKKTQDSSRPKCKEGWVGKSAGIVEDSPREVKAE
jgi:hypothetical protein